MKTYLVGGAVRDLQMGKNPKDMDYVVVGATMQDMLDAGFQQVGADFPVFLHPETGDEFALARVERKEGHGYHGFVVEATRDVTLEEDLERRDLTVNAMALDKSGNLVDPFNGKTDLENKVLRHVSTAFADDPLRVLRVARFLARFGPEWTVAEETKGMCSLLSETGELDNLTNERVWKEMSRAMMERNPELFFEFLQEVGALEKVLPEVAQLAKAKENLKWHPEGNAFAHTMLVLKQAVVHNGDLELRLAALCHDLGKGTTPVELMELGKHHGHETRSVYLTRDMMKRLGQGGRLVKRLEKVSRFHMHMHKLETLNPKTFVKMFNEMDALRDPDVVRLLFDLGCCDSRGRLGAELEQPYAHHLMLFEAFEAFESVNFKSVFGDEVVKDGNKVKTRLDKARLDAVKEWKRNA